MSIFHQRLREDLSDPEFAEAFYDMSADIALLQILEEARKTLNIRLPEFDLESPIAGITSQNLHEEVDFGALVGRELW